jgi:dihydropteroate synthase
MQLTANGSTLDLTFPQVMGILNVTPDSFSDGGRHNTLDLAIHHAQEMINAGATILDIGGESTRPGAAEVSDDEELSRVVPVVEALAKRFDVWLSVDTSKASVIRESAGVGAHLINDIRSLQEPGAIKAAAESGLPVCLMHMQGEPKTMQHAPQYGDLIAEVDQYFVQHIAQCIDAGIPREKLLLDPGFGFGKNLHHNYELLARLAEFQLLHVSPEQRVTGSVACAVIAAMQGAHIVRVHDVKETVQAMRIVEATLSAKKG